MQRRALGAHLIFAIGFVVVLASSSIAAPTASEKCNGSKLKATGAAVYAEAKCHQKATLSETAVDGACITGAEGKLSSSFSSAEGKGGCEVTGNYGDARDGVEACITSFASAISGDVACAAYKMKAVGKKTSAKMKCWQKGVLGGGSAASDCLSKAEDKFDSAIVKADSLGNCTDTGPALEALVDDCVTSLVTTANQTTTTTTTTTTTAPDSCTLNDNTTVIGTPSPNDCGLLDRDTSACDASRGALGLTGYWLKFSCRVTLGKSGSNVTAQSDGQPDYKSNYFANANPCHETYTGGIQNPNTIAAQSYSLTFPASPNTTAQTMNGTAVVGLSINGVPIFGNFAAPGDNIFDEAATFDRCGAHPQNTGKYHYHSEPYAITYDDSSFVGVMRDGYPIYGRRDPDNSLPTDLDAYGAHTSVTVDSPGTPVYHYHVNEQINPENASDSQWFITTGQFRGTPGACTGCN